MRTLARVALALVFVGASAIPAAALTVKNASPNEIKIGVDTGPTEKVYTIAPAASADIAEDCGKGCSLTGPWGYSRTVKTGETIETDGASLVTSLAAPKSTATKATAPASKKHKVVKAKAKAKKASVAKATKASEPTAKAKSRYFKGSFASLFSGRVE